MKGIQERSENKRVLSILKGESEFVIEVKRMK